MTLARNFPFFSILLCLVGSVLTSVLKPKAARALTVIISGVVLVLSAFTLRYALAMDAAEAGAAYVAFGAFFPTTTKATTRRASPALLREAATLGVPRVAIGGITPVNARPLVAAGADLLAVVGGVFDAPDPVAALRAYLRCYADL